MRFKRHQKMLKVRLLIYLFLVLYVLVTYFKGGDGASRVPIYIYLLVLICVLLVAIFHIYMTGYSLMVSEEGISKEWRFLGFVFRKKKIVQFERLFIQLENDIIRFYDFDTSGAVRSSYSFGKAESGGIFASKNNSYIPIYKFRDFIVEVFLRVKHGRIEEETRLLASKLSITLGENIQIIKRS